LGYRAWLSTQNRCDENYRGRAIVVRDAWSTITATSAHFEQSRAFTQR